MSTTHCTQCDGLGDGCVYAAPCQTCEGTGKEPVDSINRLVLKAIARNRLAGDEVSMGVAAELAKLGYVEACDTSEMACGWRMTDTGEAMLARVDNRPTSRSERPGPPGLPKGWAPYGLGMYRYASDTVTGVALDIGDVTLTPWARTWQPLPERLAVKIEVAQATLDILTYLRAHLAHQSRTAPVTSGGPSPLADVGAGDGIGAPAQLGESLR